MIFCLVFHSLTPSSSESGRIEVKSSGKSSRAKNIEKCNQREAEAEI